MKYQEHKARLMKDPTFRAAREALEPEYQVRRRFLEIPAADPDVVAWLMQQLAIRIVEEEGGD